MGATHRKPCSLAALGMVSALGNSSDEIWPRLVAGDLGRFTSRDDLVPHESLAYGQVRGVLPPIHSPLDRYDCLNNRLALAALQQIQAPLEAMISRVGPARVGVVVGTSTGGIAEAELAFRARAATGELSQEFDLAQLEFGGLAEFVSIVSGAAGPAYTLSTACSSGAKALVAARTLIELELCDAVIAGAADSLCRLTANGFRALQAVSKRRTNPMSVHRDGISLGEGAALFLVTGDADGVQLLGAGASSDAYHMSAPEPNGLGAEQCMRAALEDAQIGPGQISYLNLHGTGTPQNDAMESAAIERVLGTSVPCSSTKPLVGHTLGAAGALEVGLCWLVLANAEAGRLQLPPHRWDGCVDPKLPPLRFTERGDRLDAGVPALVMSNAFGFGGSNCSIVLRGPAA